MLSNKMLIHGSVPMRKCSTENMERSNTKLSKGCVGFTQSVLGSDFTLLTSVVTPHLT